MPPAENRFHTERSVRRVMQYGRPIRSRYTTVRVVDSRHPASRVAVIVSKKVFKSAVKRNRIRRRIYNIVRHDILHTKPSVDITINVFSPDVLIIDHRLLSRDILTLLQAGLQSARSRKT